MKYYAKEKGVPIEFDTQNERDQWCSMRNLSIPTTKAEANRLFLKYRKINHVVNGSLFEIENAYVE